MHGSIDQNGGGGLAPPAAVPVRLPPHYVYAPYDPHPERIAIIGANLKTRAMAPAPNTGWQRWSCSRANIGEHADVWFELHPWDWLQEKSPPWLAWLSVHPRVYMQQSGSELAQACGWPAQAAPRGWLGFPKQMLVEVFGPYFFTSQVAWMLAAAILQQPRQIGLWGIEMGLDTDAGLNAQIAVPEDHARAKAARVLAALKDAPDPVSALATSFIEVGNAANEYAYQRPGVHYFVQIARQRGIDVLAPEGSRILEPPLPYRGWRA